MLLSYDSEGDVLEVVFDETLHHAQIEQTACRLRDGFILYVAADSGKPIQLTIVNYLGLAHLPVVHFDGWQQLTEAEQKQFLPVITSPSVTTFFKLDPLTGYGHLSSPPMAELFSTAA